MAMASNNVHHGAAPESHHFGSRCRHAPIFNPRFSSHDPDHVPPLNAHFFYLSLIPIDDPLSTSTLSATNDAKSSRSHLRPFSTGDNNALERAWLDLTSDEYRRNHIQARRNRSASPSLAEANADRLANIVRDLAAKHAAKHVREGPVREVVLPADNNLPTTETALSLCCPELLSDVGISLRASFCAIARQRQHTLDRDRVAQDVMAEMKNLRTESTEANTKQLVGSGSPASDRPRGQSLSKPSTNARSTSGPSTTDALADPSYLRARSHSQTAPRASPAENSTSLPIPTKPSFVDDGISGKPFIRVGTPDTSAFSPPPSLPRATVSIAASNSGREKAIDDIDSLLHPGKALSSIPERGRKRRRSSVEVPVGISRLHEVSLPALQMKPIYWSPVNDIATVLRATWFYRDDMRPIDAAVANQLEAGYRELRPNTETWSDELKCAVDVGPLGEEKVSHPLWPKETDVTLKGRGGLAEPIISSNPFCAARCFRGEAAAEGNLLPKSNEDNWVPVHVHKKFEQYHVIYQDSTTAFLLKPSLRPSAYYGRRPVAKILKGFTIGVPVVRGFDYDVWKRKHQKKQGQQQSGRQVELSFDSFSRAGGLEDAACPACQAEKERHQVTDLVLVAHGIGQKLAERVENYHFTHAINAFRRAINIELTNDAVRGVLREGQNGIMVLPVNWRQNLSFEDGGPMKEEDKAAYATENFGLKDIEPKTIPAVRSMISDVMFDIPFYMSHHKPKMVAALVAEANRVYRLWCQNNPGFSDNGKVHLIGHSLGSVMSLEVLSRQPTTVPSLQLTKPLDINFFEFNTNNLFLLGSPSAFFLLLERGALLPRRGRVKPGADPTDAMSDEVVGDMGSFGCLAVDNIYNILAREDPVGYFLNGTLDAKYAASLKVAYVPSASTSLIESMGNAVRSLLPGVSSTSANAANPALVKPPTVRLPSQLELEVHDFTREDIAEKKAYLLNDNGQIDYFLRSGGGPLELQYLNMLSAHTSYWVNHDLIRMLCMEIGRKPGKVNTLPAMRAVKATRRNIPLPI